MTTQGNLTNGAEPPLLTRLALNELYTKLGDYLSDPPAQRVMRELTGPGKVYIPPEGLREFRNELIEAVLTIAIPIAWWDWELKQEQAEATPPVETSAHTEQQWGVWYGGPDPNNAAGLVVHDDEADAQEAFPWFRSDLGSGIAVRDLTVSPWRVVESEVSE